MTIRCTSHFVVWLITVNVLAPQIASADDVTPHDAGVCNTQPKNKKKAIKLATRAHNLHKDAEYRRAGDTYVEAITYWNRPRYHLKAGIAYMSAMRVMDAHSHIAEVLRCGKDVLSQDELDLARKRMQRLKKYVLAEIEVDVSEPGAHVQLNGTIWFVGPGTQVRTVRNGQHVLTVEKPGHVKVFKPITLESGERAVIQPRLLSEREGTIIKRRWRQKWLPWTIAGAGLTASMVGLVLRSKAVSDMGDYQRDIRALCEQTDSCTADQQTTLSERRTRSIRMNKAGWTILPVGSVALITGLTMAFLNREESSAHPDAGKADVQIVPLMVENAAGLSASGRF